MAGLLSGAVLSTILGFLFVGKMTRVEETVKSEFQTGIEIFKSQRSWKEQSISELLGPVNMQLDRTDRAFKRWTAKNLYIEAKVIREGNITIRDLLLEKGHLIPPELLEDAGRLVEHYDVWLELFEKQRVFEKPDLSTPFVFAGPKGYPFPKKSADIFQKTFRQYWEDLYLHDPTGDD